MVIDPNKEYNLKDFQNCLCGKECIPYCGYQYRCYECKLIIQCYPCTLDTIWIGWDPIHRYDDQQFFLCIHFDYKGIDVCSFGNTIKQLQLPEIIDIKQIHNSLDTYKLLI